MILAHYLIKKLWSRYQFYGTQSIFDGFLSLNLFYPPISLSQELIREFHVIYLGREDVDHRGEAFTRVHILAQCNANNGRISGGITGGIEEGLRLNNFLKLSLGSGHGHGIPGFINSGYHKTV